MTPDKLLNEQFQRLMAQHRAQRQQVWRVWRLVGWGLGKVWQAAPYLELPPLSLLQCLLLLSCSWICTLIPPPVLTVE